MNRRLIIIFFCIMLLIVATTFTLAQTPSEEPATPTPVWNVVIGQDVFLRGGPGEEYLPVGALQAGDQITPVSRNADATWIMITYRRGFGWIRWDLAYWIVTLNALPIIDADNLTPSPVPGAETATPFFPTSTPSGNYINLFGANSAFIRAGPGTTYLRLGQLYPGDSVEPVGRNENTSWIMIRFEPPPSSDVLGAEFEFGWLQRNLVLWLDEDNLEDLPVLSEDNLTPTVTFTPSLTPTFTTTPTITSTVTLTTTSTITPSLTLTVTPSVTSTLTYTIVPSATATATATETNTITPTATLTLTNTDIPSPTWTSTASPTETATQTYTDVPIESDTPILTDTVIPSSTATLTVTNTNTDFPTATETVTDIPTMPTTTNTIVLPSDTAIPTETEIPPTWTSTPTATVTESPIPPTSTDLPATPTEAEVIAVIVTEEDSPSPTALLPTETSPPNTPTAEVSPEVTEEIVAIATDVPATPVIADVILDEGDSGGKFPAEIIVAGIIILLVVVYVIFYLRGVMFAERYADGFVIESCPVCQRGHLTVESRIERILGVPRPRRTVRCDACRSVLRQTGDRWWRYAVDPLENPAMFDRFNNREIDDSTLILLGREPVHPESSRSVQPPDFVDDESNS